MAANQTISNLDLDFIIDNQVKWDDFDLTRSKSITYLMLKRLRERLMEYENRNTTNRTTS